MKLNTTLSIISPQQMKRCSKWSTEDLERLNSLINDQHDRQRKDWIAIASLLGNKTPRQCYDAFHLQLSKDNDSQINRRHMWTEEEITILTSFKSQNTTWQRFQSDHFPYLSVCQIKNKYRQLQLKQQSPAEADKFCFVFKKDENITLCHTPIASALTEGCSVTLYQEEDVDQIFIDPDFLNIDFE